MQNVFIVPFEESWLEKESRSFEIKNARALLFRG